MITLPLSGNARQHRLRSCPIVQCTALWAVAPRRENPKQVFHPDKIILVEVGHAG